jgi:hypothetical protein
MKRMMAVMMFVAVAGSMAAMAMTTNGAGLNPDPMPHKVIANDTELQQAIDSRLHDMLVQMRVTRYGH